MIASFAVAAVLIAAIPIRGVILSGYPLYPFPALPANVDWRAPHSQTELERIYITSWAQQRPTYHRELARGWSWVRPWGSSTVLTDRFDIFVPLILTLVTVPVFIWQRPNEISARDAQRGPPGWAYAFLASASIVTLVVWFFQAPAGRFAFAHFWILLAVMICSTVRKHAGPWPWIPLLMGLALAGGCAAFVLFSGLNIPRQFRSGMVLILIFAGIWILLFARLHGSRRAAALLCFLLGIFPVVHVGLGNLAGRRYGQLGALAWLNVTDFSGDILDSPTVSRTTYSGLTVYEKVLVYYDTPLPNTRFFNPYLTLRKPPNLQSGFANSACRLAGTPGYTIEVNINGGGGEEDFVKPESCSAGAR
jgi:hypothetical protein